MPCERTHREVGTLAGALAALHNANAQAPGDQLLELVGGGLGGRLGGCMPDVLEPAISSWHRGTAHSYSLLMVAYHNRERLLGAAEWCREKARDLRSQIPSSPGRELSLEFWAAAWALMAGFLVGFAAGYVSHLALDALTPRGLPVVWRSC
jgi:hypothetical protein